MSLRIACLASGHGTILQAIIDACESESLDGGVCAVISNNSKCGAAERAQRHGVPFRHLSSVTHPDPQTLDAAICEFLESAQTEIVFLAGYLKKLGPRTLDRFRGRILNTHPALLPKFGGQGMYGINVHRAVIEAGEKESGVSVHLVEPEYDTGGVIAQQTVPVREDDTPETLSERVILEERKLVVEVLRELSGKRFPYFALLGK